MLSVLRLTGLESLNSFMYTDEELAKLILATHSDIFIFHYIQSRHAKLIGYNLRVPHSPYGMCYVDHCILDGDCLVTNKKQT